MKNSLSLFVFLISLMSLVSCTKAVIVPADKPIKKKKIVTEQVNLQPVLTGRNQTSPTEGWNEVPFSYSIQKPYNLLLSDRYSYDSATDTHSFWIYPTDMPHALGSTTSPRCEMMIKDQYTSGKRQLEADVYVDPGTDNVCLMQVYGGTTSSTSFMAMVYQQNNGTIRRFNGALLDKAVYGSWIHMNVIHDADANTVQVYIDGELKGTFNDNGDATHYFKCGVYGAATALASAKFRHIKYWTKP